MKPRSLRILEALAELLPMARAADWPGLWDRLFGIFVDRDTVLFDALLVALRAEGLREAWTFCWNQGLDIACHKRTVQGRQHHLLALRLTPVWTGSCTAAERQTLNRTIKTRGQFPRRGKLTWFAIPQPLGSLMEVSPMLWWFLNQPESRMPYPWQRQTVSVPLPYLLLGRLDTPAQTGALEWPDPDTLVEALGWPEGSIDAAGPLDGFLCGEEEEGADPVGLLVREIAGNAVLWCRAQGAEASACRAILEAAGESRFGLYLQAQGKDKSRFLQIEAATLPLSWETFVARLQEAFAEVGLPLFTELPGIQPPGFMLH